MRPPTHEELKKELNRLRDDFAREMTNGKTTKWKELKLWDRMRVDAKAKTFLRMRQY